MIFGTVLGVIREVISPNVTSPLYTLLCKSQSFLPRIISVNGRPNSLSKQRSLVKILAIVSRVIEDKHERKEETRREEREEDEEKGGEKKFLGIIKQEHFDSETGDNREDGEFWHTWHTSWECLKERK
jgi:hypothetical protein